MSNEDVCQNYHGGADTSEQAFKSLPETVRDKQGQKLLRLLRKIGGCTCDQLEMVANLSHQSTSARLTGLRKAGYIRACTDRRLTRSGRSARVYEITGRGRDALAPAGTVLQ